MSTAQFYTDLETRPELVEWNVGGKITYNSPGSVLHGTNATFYNSIIGDKNGALLSSPKYNLWHGLNGTTSVEVYIKFQEGEGPQPGVQIR
jgi:hypothetical protein